MPAAYERCLKHVQGKVRNKYAVCTAANAGGIKEYRKTERKSARYKKAHG